MWEPRRLTSLWASTACYRDSFTFTSLEYGRRWPTFAATISREQQLVSYTNHISDTILSCLFPYGLFLLQCAHPSLPIFLFPIFKNVNIVISYLSSESFQSVLLAAISDLPHRSLSVYMCTATISFCSTCSPAICTVLYFAVSRLLSPVFKRFSFSFCYRQLYHLLWFISNLLCTQLQLPEAADP
jgi:hypothetical protein